MHAFEYGMRYLQSSFEKFCINWKFLLNFGLTECFWKTLYVLGITKYTVCSFELDIVLFRE